MFKHMFSISEHHDTLNILFKTRAKKVSSSV